MIRDTFTNFNHFMITEDHKDLADLSLYRKSSIINTLSISTHSKFHWKNLFHISYGASN